MLRRSISTWFSGASMSRTCRQKRYMTGRHFCLEPLESRQLLAGVSAMVSSVTQLFPSSSGNVAPSGIVTTPAVTTPNVSPADTTNAAESIITTSPANGAVLTQSPSSLTVTFNRNVRRFSFSRIVQLEQVNNDGSTTPLFGPSNPAVASFDPTGTQATILLNQTLAPGHYRIVLVGGSLMAMRSMPAYGTRPSTRPWPTSPSSIPHRP